MGRSLLELVKENTEGMPDAPGGGEGSKKKTERDVSFKKKNTQCKLRSNSGVVLGIYLKLL